ncbi:MAG: metallophosphoesterase family protein, partial [Campylobacterota bacterium]
IYPQPHYFKLKDTTFKLMHLPFYLAGDVRVVISGHTHEFSCEKKGRTLFLNPGEVCARNKPVSEYATLTVQEGRYKVVHYFKDLQTKKLHTKEFEYEQ